jgi:protein-S-isoprenylcysteine O-methyltransferase Ste14
MAGTRPARLGDRDAGQRLSHHRRGRARPDRRLQRSLQVVRHPSYTGLLLIVAGFGAALGNCLSLTVCVVLPLPAILWRIHVEEAELNHVLGEAFRSYQSDRARLIPRFW